MTPPGAPLSPPGPARAAAVAPLLRAAGAPPAVPPGVFLAAAAGAAVGIAAVALGLVFVPGPTWGGVLANFLFWIGLAQGGVVVAAAFVLTGARWGRVVQRMAGGMGAFLPVSLVIFALLWLGRAALFPRLGAPNRPRWLGVEWLFVRDGLALAAMTVLCLAFIAASVRPGALWARDRDERGRRAQEWLAAAVAISFFLLSALLVVDLEIRWEPRFPNSVLPILSIVGSLYAALAVTAVLAVAWCRSGEPRRLFTREHRLHLGNLVWNFGMLLAYTWWSQHLVIWMGNLPDEVAMQFARWQTGWSPLAWATLATAVILPFLLLSSRRAKAQPMVLAAASAIGAAGVLLERFLEILPALQRGERPGGALVQVGVTLGFGGLFALSYLWLMRRVPLFPVEDPLLTEELLLQDVRV